MQKFPLVIKMSKEKHSKNSSQTVECSVRNCNAKIPVDEVMQINGQNYCKICGTAIYRNFLNI